MQPVQVEPTARAGMGALKRWYNHINFTVTSGGSGNTQTLTYSVAPAAIVAGDRFAFSAGFTNTGPATLNINGLGAIAVVTNTNAALTGGEITAGLPVEVEYDGTSFRIILPYLQVPSGINNPYPVSSGTANAQTLNYTVAPPLITNYRYVFIAGLTNSTAATMNINGTGVKSVLRYDGSALGNGDITTGQQVTLIYDGTNFRVVEPIPIPTAAAPTIPRSYLAGLTLSTAGGSGIFGIAAGQAVDSTNAAFMGLATAYTKTTASWLLGSGNGGLDTGAIANTTCYHVFLIMRVDTGVTDILFSLSPSAPTMPTNYTLFRRIGSMLTDASAHWIAFWQVGDEFGWVTTVQSVAVTNLGATATNYALTVPTGVSVKARFRGFVFNASSAVSLLIFATRETGTTAVAVPVGNVNAITSAANVIAALEMDIITNTSAQISAVANVASTNLTLVTHGWIDSRGRND